MKQHPIIFAAAASTALASPTIRGRRPHKNHSNGHKRPPIKDERQAEKIRQWNEFRRGLHQIPSNDVNAANSSNSQRKLPTSMLSYHTKGFSDHYTGTSNIHVKVEEGPDLGFQTKDDLGSSSSTTSTEQPKPQSENVNNQGGPFKYYPSFDMKLYPDGACLNDGKNPQSYTFTPDGFLFDGHKDCCIEWFIDVDLCLAATGGEITENTQQVEDDQGQDGDDQGNAPAPSASPGETPWPTWSDDVFEEDSGGDGDMLSTTATSTTYEAVSSSATQAAFSSSTEATSTASTPETTVTTTPETTTSSTSEATALATDDVFNYNPPPQGGNSQVGTQGQSSQNSQNPNNPQVVITPPSPSFYESFESGDFSTHPWKQTTSSTQGDASSIDPWAADRTAHSYEGKYAARPGILSEEGSVTNLTISLNDLDDNGTPDGVFPGGLLSFAIHAAVDMPVDALYFCINDHVIRTFDTVTGYVAGDWEEVSTLLLPGEHTLSWSYQFYGMPEDESLVDPRRVGNSWIDDIRLTPYTGDYVFGDGEVDTLDMSNGLATWGLVQDPNAFEGEKSLIAYSQDIVSNKGSIEMSWTIVVSPDGGTVSFAAYASIYAPHDVLEFSVDNMPKVAITIPSLSWEEFEVEVDPGRHVCTWKLVKNIPGLNQNVINGVGVPDSYQGYAKVDGIRYEDNMKDVLTTEAPKTPATTTSTTTTTTTEESTTTTTTTTSTTTTTTTTTDLETTTVAETTTSTSEEATTTSEAPEDETTALPTTEAPEDETTEAPTTEAPEDETTEAPTTEAQVDETTGAPEAMAAFTGCPDGLQEVQGLPGCCVEDSSYLGDGACDPWEPYNTEACGYDLGDCCHDTCNTDSPYGCKTKEGADYGPFGFFCLDPRSSSVLMDVEKCKVENREWIGDGGCDSGSEYNTPECGYDGGDCCEGTCDEEFAFYSCGREEQPYECLSSDR